ncbi:MAG: hypothetical protein AAF203_04720 [Pseudomonadota bacterium]
MGNRPSNDFNDETDDAILEQLSSNYLDPKARSWEGLCDQWAAATLDHQVNFWLKKFENNKDKLCGGQSFSYAEIKELFSFLFPLQGASHFLGELQSDRWDDFISRSSTNSVSYLSEAHILSRASYGLDDLDPIDFIRFTNMKMHQGEGFILEKDYGPQIWNYPVHSASLSFHSTEIQKWPVKVRHEEMPFFVARTFSKAT